MRLVGLTDESLWLDEGYTLERIQPRTPLGVVARCADDVHPPLFFLLLHAFTAVLGTSDFVLRLLPAVLSAATVPVAGMLGARLAGRRVGLVVAGLVALSPLLVRIAQDARPYALLGLLTVAASERWLAARDGPTRARFVAWALLLGAAVVTHVLAAGVAVLHLLWAHGLSGRPVHRRVRRATWRGLAAVALLAALWGMVVLRNRSSFLGYGQPTDLLRALADVVGTRTAAVSVAAVAGAGLALHRARHGRLPRGVAPGLASAAVIFAIPLLGAWGWGKPMFAPRLVAHAVPFLAVAIAAGLLAVARRGRVAAVGVAVAVLLAFGLGHVRRVVRVDREEWRAAAAYVSQRLGDGDAVYVEGSAARTLLRHYLPAKRASQVERKALYVEDRRRVFLVSSIHDRAREARRAEMVADRRRETDVVRWVQMEVSTWER